MHWRLRRLILVVAMAWAGAIACGSQHAASPNASGPGSTTSSTQPSTRVSQSAPATATVAPSPTSTPTCVGLSICTPPPPDAEGHPACYYADGWRADASGGGIEVWYFYDPQSPSKPDTITALVRKKDGTKESQDAKIAAGQQVHRFEFSTVASSTVDQVLLSSSTGRCFVIGPQS
jgi:hypothetical protein